VPSFDECFTSFNCDPISPLIKKLTPLQQALEKLDNDKKEAEKKEAAPTEQQEVSMLGASVYIWGGCGRLVIRFAVLYCWRKVSEERRGERGEGQKMGERQ
jgi:hypothetical protein